MVYMSSSLTLLSRSVGVSFFVVVFPHADRFVETDLCPTGCPSLASSSSLVFRFLRCASRTFVRGLVLPSIVVLDGFRHVPWVWSCTGVATGLVEGDHLRTIQSSQRILGGNPGDQTRVEVEGVDPDPRRLRSECPSSRWSGTRSRNRKELFEPG